MFIIKKITIHSFATSMKSQFEQEKNQEDENIYPKYSYQNKVAKSDIE